MVLFGVVVPAREGLAQRELVPERLVLPVPKAPPVQEALRELVAWLVSLPELRELVRTERQALVPEC